MTQKIDTGIPIPPTRKPRFDFARLDPEQSFHIPGETVKLVSRHASYWGGKLGRKFIVRKEHNGVRVWRIS